jgi:hypothetical protein
MQAPESKGGLFDMEHQGLNRAEGARGRILRSLASTESTRSESTRKSRAEGDRKTATDESVRFFV